MKGVVGFRGLELCFGFVADGGLDMKGVVGFRGLELLGVKPDITGPVGLTNSRFSFSDDTKNPTILYGCLLLVQRM